jgi:hypothetical protein
VHPLAKDGMRVGEVSLFFGAQFVLCLLETLLMAALPISAIRGLAALPGALKVVGTAVLICSFGQLFCENLLAAGMFSAMQDLFPRVVRS